MHRCCMLLKGWTEMDELDERAECALAHDALDAVESIAIIRRELAHPRLVKYIRTKLLSKRASHQIHVAQHWDGLLSIGYDGLRIDL